MLALGGILICGPLAGTGHAQAPIMVKRTETRPADEVKSLTAKDLQEAVARGTEYLIALQARSEGADEKSPPCEWSYEGVYRAGGKIPVAYRTGGTAITVMALVQAPGYKDDAKRQAAVAEAVKFIIAQNQHPLMSYKDYDAGYDVRGWGYTYGLLCFCDLRARGLVPAGQQEAVTKACEWFIQAIETTQIPVVGGWNYARPAGKEKPAAPSTFMTPATVQALFAAQALGMKVDQTTITKAVTFMEQSIAAEDADGGKSAGSVTYAGPQNARRPEKIPGAVGRMCVTEATLAMAGRSSEARLTRAVESFVTHWDELDKRRQKSGTHEGPYGVAPYYFMFAHFYASQAIEMLPAERRAALREKCDAQLFRVRDDNGSWNDRVFKRSSGYGTAMAMMAIMGPKTYAGKVEAAKPAEAKPAESKPADAKR